MQGRLSSLLNENQDLSTETARNRAEIEELAHLLALAQAEAERAALAERQARESVEKLQRDAGMQALEIVRAIFSYALFCSKLFALFPFTLCLI